MNRAAVGAPLDVRWLAALGALLAGVAAFGLAVAFPAAPLLELAAVAAGLLIGGLLLASRRIELSLLVLLLWLGLGDGFFRLLTGVPELTLVRDVLLYAVVAGVLVRAAAARTSLRHPPLTGWIVAIVALAIIQVLNPENVRTSYAVAALRPHLEFVPLFFLGYLVMRSQRRLRYFCAALLLIAFANGVVGFVQLNLTQEQLASWGPGFRERVFGSGVITGRFFLDERGVARVRPMALGSDVGFGGSAGTVAAPAGLALLALARRNRHRLVILAGLAGVALAVISSQTRLTVIATVAAVAAFAALGVAGRRGGRVLLGLGAGGAALWLVVLALGSDSGAFQRYRSITPTNAVQTTIAYRADNFDNLGKYLRTYPMGAGLGTGGPAVGFFEGRGNKALDSETQFNFLLIELGIPGLLLFTAFTVRLLGLSLRVRRATSDERILLAGVVAPLFALAVSWVVATPTTTSPGAPYFWFAAGVVAWWCAGGRHASPRDQTGPAAA